MKAIIVIEIDENHLLKEMNELYDRLNGYKCELIPMPQRKNEEIVIKGHTGEIAEAYQDGWNACIDEILGETE